VVEGGRMKCIIAGSRSITDYDTVKAAFNACPFKDKITEVVSGTAKGVDILGERLAFEYDIKVSRFPADWKRFGKRAGRIRNEQMGDYADCVIAVWDGYSTGTKHMVDYMCQINKRVFVYCTREKENDCE
jgi:hypothetical protein